MKKKFDADGLVKWSMLHLVWIVFLPMQISAQRASVDYIQTQGDSSILLSREIWTDTLLQSSLLFERGQPSFRYEYTYVDGKRTEERIFKFDRGDSSLQWLTNYKDGKKIRSIRYDAPGQIGFLDSLSYNPQGQLVSEFQYLFLERKKIEAAHYEYSYSSDSSYVAIRSDFNRDLELIASTFIPNKLADTIRRTFDAYGRITTQKWIWSADFYWKGANSLASKETITYSYYGKSRRIRKRTTSVNGKETFMVKCCYDHAGHLKKRVEHDLQNHVIRKTCYDATQKPISVEFRKGKSRQAYHYERKRIDP